MYKIEIENNVTHQKYTYDNVEDKNNGKKLFYNFNLDTSNLDDGEYTLSLYDGNNLITSELLKIGDFNNKSIQYSKGNNIYIDAKPNKIDLAATGIKLSLSTFSEIPDIFDFSNVTDMNNMFYRCDKLTTIPQIDTSNATNMYYMFAFCSSLQSIPMLNTSKATDMGGMFKNCEKLTTIPQIDTSNATNMYDMFGNCYSLQSIPLLNTTNVTTMSSMFDDCFKLTTIPQFDTSNVTNMGYMFQNCTNLQSLPLLDCGSVTNMYSFFGSSYINTLTDLGGFKDLKITETNYFLITCPSLTVESIMNVINNLFDWTDYPDGKAPLNDGKIHNFGISHSLKFGSTNLNKLTEEQIAIATAKGWTLIS